MKFVVQICLGVICIALCGAGLNAVLPQAREAAQILAAQDDPVSLSDLQVGKAARLDPGLIEREIELALQAGDADLAQSFLDLGVAQNIPIAATVAARVADANAEAQSVTHLASRFATGFVTGDTSDFASLSGTVTGDLFTFGDIRDVIKEGGNLLRGAEADRLVLGLAAVGLAVTAGTYASVGAISPMRAGLSVFKGAQRSARISAGLSTWVRRAASEVVDTPLLQKAAASASFIRPAQTVDAFKAAIRTDKAGLLVTAVKDVGRVGNKAGTRAALDVIKVADNPKDLARAARLAEAKGGQTRAILKILGRGALLLTAGAFNLTMWLFSALLFLIGAVTSIKSTTERITLAWLRRARIKRLKRAAAGADAVALTAAPQIA